MEAQSWPGRIGAESFTANCSRACGVFVAVPTTGPLALLDAMTGATECAAGVTFAQFPLRE
ncbi:MAG: hypothetical protein U5R48_08875 [Gammaproteobacteria bacterium]|nr:hypothetical protein [Gammaproteobacteria bacterium]